LRTATGPQAKERGPGIQIAVGREKYRMTTARCVPTFGFLKVSEGDAAGADESLRITKKNRD